MQRYKKNVKIPKKIGNNIAVEKKSCREVFDSSRHFFIFTIDRIFIQRNYLETIAI